MGNLAATAPSKANHVNPALISCAFDLHGGKILCGANVMVAKFDISFVLCNLVIAIFLWRCHVFVTKKGYDDALQNREHTVGPCINR